MLVLLTLSPAGRRGLPGYACEKFFCGLVDIGNLQATEPPDGII